MEKKRSQDTQNLFMRVKVALPTSKPLRRGAFLGCSEGQRMWVSFKYEQLPIFCHFCGVLGHDLKHCAKHFAQKKNGREAVCQYDDWLKTNGGRNRSFSRKMESNIENQFGRTDEDLAGEISRPAVQVDEELHAANVTDNTNGALNECANHGTEADSNHMQSVTDGINLESMGTSTPIIKPTGDDSKLVNVPVRSELKQVETNFSTPLPVQ